MLVRLYKNDVSASGKCAVYYDVDESKYYVPAGQIYSYKGDMYLTHTRIRVVKAELRRLFFTNPYFSINMGKGLVRVGDLDIDITVKGFDVKMRKEFINEYVPKSEIFTLEQVMSIIEDAKSDEVPEKTFSKKDRASKGKEPKSKASEKPAEVGIPSISEFNKDADKYVAHQEYDLVAMRRELARLRDDNAALARKCKIEKEYAYLEEKLREEREKNARLRGIIMRSDYSSYGGSDES